jgi:hypothetical protein
MPGATRATSGNELFDQIILINFTYPTLGANANATNTNAVLGVQPYDGMSFNLIAPPAHLFLDNCYVSANNVVTCLWSTDATGISTGSVQVLLQVVRPENATSLPLGAALPNIVA